MTVATAVTTATPIMTPSRVRKDLSLWAIIEDMAMAAASINLFIRGVNGYRRGHYTKGLYSGPNESDEIQLIPHCVKIGQQGRPKRQSSERVDDPARCL